jgi:ABC-2 type transport system ATP-binding protein
MIEVLNIGELLDQPVRKLSLGQRMRCELVASLIHQPSLLFLDEPTIGLDVLVKENIRQFLREMNKEFGTTILLTTHDLTDIEALCSRVIMLDKGNIIYDGGLTRLKHEWGEGKKIHLELDQEVSLSHLDKLTEPLPVSWSKNEANTKLFTAQLQGNSITASEVLSLLVTSGVPIHEMQIQEVSTEEIVRKIYQEG